MTDDELKTLVASLAIAQQKTDEQLKKTDEQLKKTDEQLKKTDEQLKKTSEDLQKASGDLRQRQMTAEDEMKEIRRQFKKQMQELSKQIGGLGNKFGSFTEGLALPSMTKILSKKFGMTTINPSVRVCDKNGNEHEIDVLAYTNGTINTAFIVEVKSHLREEGIEQLLKQCRDFQMLFPELADKKLYGILAAVDASQQMQQKVLAHGLYFAKIHDDQFSLCVPPNFKPFCFTESKTA